MGLLPRPRPPAGGPQQEALFHLDSPVLILQRLRHPPATLVHRPVGPVIWGSGEGRASQHCHLHCGVVAARLHMSTGVNVCHPVLTRPQPHLARITPAGAFQNFP